MTMTSRGPALSSLAALPSLAVLVTAGDADAAGKLDASSNKTDRQAARPRAPGRGDADPGRDDRRSGQGDPGRAARPRRARPLTAAAAEPPRLRLDPARGALRSFRGRVANPHGRGLVAARAMLAEHRDVLNGLSAAADAVALVERHASDDDGTHLVADVTWNGLPVWGAEVAAHFADDGALTAIHAQNTGALTPALVVRYGPQAAQQRARRWNADGAQDGVVTDLGAPELGVWPGGHARGTNGALAWRLVQSVRQADGAPQHYATFVAAGDGTVLARHPLVATDGTLA